MGGWLMGPRGIVVEYRLCEAKTTRKLKRTLNQLLGAGWRPIGGVSVAQPHSTNKWWYYQALVRDQESIKLAPSGSEEFAKPQSNGFGDLD